MPLSADPPLCDSTLAGNTDSTRIRARIICSRTPIRARIIPTETRDVVRCSSLAHGLPVSPPPPTPSPEWPRSGARVGWVSPGGCGQRANHGREPPPVLVCWATHRTCTDRDPMLPRHTVALVPGPCFPFRVHSAPSAFGEPSSEQGGSGVHTFVVCGGKDFALTAHCSKIAGSSRSLLPPVGATTG